MVTYKEVAERKFKLIERFRSALLEEMLEEGRELAMVERKKDCFAWKGRFLPREEILQLYAERKRWDRRFLIDTFVLALLLLGVTFSAPMLVATVAPRSSWKSEAQRHREAAEDPVPVEEGSESAAENAGE